MRALCLAMAMVVTPVTSVAAAPVFGGGDFGEQGMVDAQSRPTLDNIPASTGGLSRPGATLTFRWAEESEQIASFDTSIVTAPGSVVANAVVPVPEPTTWAMLLAGFGLVGGALRGQARRATYA